MCMPLWPQRRVSLYRVNGSFSQSIWARKLRLCSSSQWTASAPCSMKFAYDSVANRPAYCDPAGAMSGIDTGRSLPDSEFGPHSVTMIGMSAGQPNIGVASAERTSREIPGISLSGARGGS